MKYKVHTGKVLLLHNHSFILRLVGGHFSAAAAAELISCDREHVISKAKNSYHPAFGRKSLLTPVLGQRPLRACSDHCPVGSSCGVGCIQSCSVHRVEPWARSSVGSVDLCLGQWAW